MALIHLISRSITRNQRRGRFPLGDQKLVRLALRGCVSEMSCGGEEGKFKSSRKKMTKKMIFMKSDERDEGMLSDGLSER
jgi:hypothetical protein